MVYWPEYAEKAKARLILIHFFGGLYSLDFWKDFLKVLAIYTVYIILVFHCPIPFSSRPNAVQMVEKWWLFDLFDALLTGYALRNVSIFSAGLFAVWPLHARMAVHKDWRLAKKYTISECLMIICLSALFTGWFTRNGIIRFEFKYMLISFSLIFLGSTVMRFLVGKLVSLNFGSIVTINFAIFSFKFITDNLHAKNYSAIVALIALSLFIGSCILYSLKKREHLSVWNLSGNDFEQSSFPIPFVMHRAISFFTVCAAIGSILFSISLDLLIPSIAPSYTNIWLVLAFICVGIVLAHRLSIDLDPIVLQFNPREMADDLKSHFWTFDNIRPGEETSLYLSSLYVRITKRSAIYTCFKWFCVVIACFLYSLITGDHHAFIYGPVGLMFLLPGISWFFLHLGRKVVKCGGDRSSTYALKYGMAGGKLVQILDPSRSEKQLSLEELILHLVDPAHIEDVKVIFAECGNDKIKLVRRLPRILQYVKQDHKEQDKRFSKTLVSFLCIMLSCLLVSMFLLAIASLFTKMFNIILSENEYYSLMITFVAFWLGMTISVFTYLNPRN